jgi:hypothetical protein
MPARDPLDGFAGVTAPATPLLFPFPILLRAAEPYSARVVPGLAASGKTPLTCASWRGILGTTKQAVHCITIRDLPPLGPHRRLRPLNVWRIACLRAPCPPPGGDQTITPPTCLGHVVPSPHTQTLSLSSGEPAAPSLDLPRLDCGLQASLNAVVRFDHQSKRSGRLPVQIPRVSR